MNKNLLLLSFLTCALTLSAEGKAVKLQESVITTENFETNIRDTASNVSIITSEEIEEKGVQNLVEALRLAPGVIVSHYYGGVKFDIRGAGSPVHAEKNTIVTLDGVPIKGDQIANIPINNIDRIEVIPGGGGILYGDGAIGGIVNIRLKNISNFDKNKLYKGEIRASASSYNSNTFGMSLSSKITNKIYTDITYNSNLKRSEQRGDQYGDLFDKRKNFIINTKFDLAKGELNLRYTRDERKYAKSGDLTEEEYYTDDKNPGDVSRGKSYSNDYYLNYNYNFSSNTQFLTYFGLYEKEFESYNAKEGTSIPQDDEQKIYSKIQLKHKYFNDDYFIIGSDFAQEIANPQNKSRKNSTKDSYGFFLMNENSIDKFIFSQGIRYNNAEYNYYFRDRKPIPQDKWNKLNKTTFNDYSYNIETKYKYNNTGVLYGKLSRDFRTPLISEMRYTVNAEKLKPQTQDTIELGIKDYIHDTYLSLSTFYKITKDEIYYSGEEYTDLFPYYNIGDTERYGFEFFGEHYFDKLTLSTSATYLHHNIKKSKFENLEGKEIPFIPNWKLGFGAKYQFTDCVLANADVLYYGKFYDSDDPTNQRPKDIGGYTTLNLSINYKIIENLTLVGKINNVFDKKYPLYVGYWSNTRQYNKAEGRIYTLEATYTF